MKTTMKWILITLFSFLMLITGVSASTTEHVVVGGTVMTKGLLGILISLGIENWVTTTQAYYCYNLISVAIIIFIAAMSGPRSEAAFTIIVPIFAALFTYFGWLRLATPSQTQGLFYLIIMMGVLGIIMYMNDQNKQNYGSVGPGSKMFNIAIYLALFGASLTMVSGFSIEGIGGVMPQPVPGTCSIGLPCDEFNNIDFTTTRADLTDATGLNIAGAGLWMLENGYKMAIIMINIIIGALFFPTIVYSTMNNLFPGIGTSTVYLAVMAVLQVVVLFIYVISMYEFFTKAPAGSTL
jgi:hypothetical protein